MVTGTENDCRGNMALALVLAFLIGAIYFYPNSTIPQKFAADTKLNQEFVFNTHPRLPISGLSGDEVGYAAMIRKIFDGTKSFGDPLIYEHRNDANLLPPLVYVFSGISAHLFGSVENYLAAVDFIFPFLGTLSVFCFVNLFYKNKIVSLWVTVAILSMFSAQRMVKEGLLMGPDLPANLIWSQASERYPSYQLILPYIFICYWLNHRLLKFVTWPNAALLGAVVGLSGYIYFYAFLGLSLQIFSIFVWGIVVRDYNLVKKYMLAGLVFLLVSGLYIKGVLVHMTGPLHLDKALVFAVTTEVPDFFYNKDLPKLIGIFLILFLALKTKLIDRAQTALLMSIVIPTTLIIFLSGQIMLFPQADHMLNFEFGNAKTILMGLFLATVWEYDRCYFVMGRWIKSRQTFFKILHRVGVVLISIFLVFSAGAVLWRTHQHFVDRTEYYYTRYVLERGVSQAYDWLNQNAQKSDVILSADGESITTMPFKTGMYNYLPNMFLSAVSIDETWSRLIQVHAFFGADRQKVESLLDYTDQMSSELSRRLDSLTQNYMVSELRKIYFDFSDSLLVRQVFHGYYLMSPKNLSFQVHQSLMSDAEILLVKMRFEKMNASMWYVPQKVREKYLTGYQVKLADVTNLSFKADYVWLGPVEKKLGDVTELNSPNLKEVYRNGTVTLYRIHK